MSPEFDFNDPHLGEDKELMHRCQQGVALRPGKGGVSPWMGDGAMTSLAILDTIEKKAEKERKERGLKSPIPLRDYLGLHSQQALFCDCGGFSWVNDDVPALSPRDVIERFHPLGIDLGIAPDHPPAEKVKIHQDGGVRILSETERKERVQISMEYAEEFLEIWHEEPRDFYPVAVAHGLTLKEH